jgi:hypothetical protein
MVLPSKHLPQNRALLSIGSVVLSLLRKPKTVSAVWEELRVSSVERLSNTPDLTYDWFVLVLDLLFSLNAVELSGGLLSRQEP